MMNELSFSMLKIYEYDISIIIPVYNSEKTIRKCILSILDSDFDKSFEIIVIDDGSTDRSMEKIKDIDVKIVHQINKGAATARNVGSRQAKSDLILFLDSDVCFFKDTLKKIYEHLKKDDIDYIGVRYSKKPLNHKWIHRYKALADYVYYYDFIFTKEQRQKPIRQVFISGGIEGFKKHVFEELGGFDEKIKGADVEQDKLMAKLSHDYNVLADGNITTAHYFPDFGKLTRDYFRRTFHAMNIVFKNNYGQPYLKKNTSRIALGALAITSLLFSIILFLNFGYTLPFIVTLILFSSYLFTHLNMFIIAFKEYGLSFTLYTLFINLYFCLLISLAGFFGMLRHLLQR